MISVNASAARRASTGELIIIAAFAQVHNDQVSAHEGFVALEVVQPGRLC